VKKFFDLLEPKHTAQLWWNWGKYCTTQEHERGRNERQESSEFSNICRTWIPHHDGNMHECSGSPCTTFSCVSSKERAYWTYGWDATWVYLRLSHVGMVLGRHVHTWFRHFISVTKSTIYDPVLVVLDGHYSYTKNLEILKLQEKIMFLFSACFHTAHIKSSLHT
jgi:hypothetical protein